MYKHSCEVSYRSHDHHWPLHYHSLLGLHTPTERRRVQEQQLPFLWEIKGCNVCRGQTSKTMVSHRGGGRTQRPAPTEDSFHATGIWSWTELCLFMLHCSTVWTTSPSSITRPRVEGINSTVWLVNLVLHSAVTAGISKTKRGLLGSWEALVSLVSEKRSWFYVLQET